MSSFIVNNHNLSNLVVYIGDKIYDSYFYYISSEFKKRLFEEIGSDREKLFNGLLYNAMYRLNIEAYKKRYGDEDAPDENNLLPFYPCKDITDAQALKSLQCWKYQCTEGDIPETSVLYGLMDVLEAILKDYIISEMPEYKSAVWGG